MSSQDNGQVSTLQRPISDDQEAWKAYWVAQGWPWRTEPEIDTERQMYLAKRRSIIPNIEQGFYPFKDIKLSRADVEWLLATHDNGRGPIDWNDEKQRDREGLDLRGANLRQENLRSLPLAVIRGGLTLVEAIHSSIEQRNMAAIHLERASLIRAQLQKANLREAELQDAELAWAQLQDADLTWANLQHTYLAMVQLQGADLYGAQMQKAFLAGAQLQGANLQRATLEHASLDRISLSSKTHGTAHLADIIWGDVNLALIEWDPVKSLGEEQLAFQKKNRNGTLKEKQTKLEEYKTAVRANRQLAAVLQVQGLNEVASRFAYRAQKLQPIVLRRQKKFGLYLFSIFLDLLAGYGYRPGRSVIWYLVTILGFALTYFAIGHLPFFPDAFVFSLTSFHGRGFFPGLGSENSLHNPLVITAAFEAVVGLLIEISFIATFTQRFFGN